MTQFFNPFLSRQKKQHITLSPVPETDFKEWIAKQNSTCQDLCHAEGFEGKTGQVLIVRNTEAVIEAIYIGSSAECTYDDGAKACKAIENKFSQEYIKETSFSINFEDTDALARLCTGWGWACYRFTRYKTKDEAKTHPGLVLTHAASKKRIKTTIEATCLARDLINIPANDLGPDELEEAATEFCKHHGLKLKTIKDKDLIKKNFPMIYEVGKGSDRRPRLLDFSWGSSKDPKVTLVGKGVCFDTGGLDIKPSQFMLHMKKDMGGSAQVLGLAHLIISLKLPIQLRVLIPAVENSISGGAYRPADVLQTRKGITVEVGNTDAEGRLVLADSLTYACEKEPELIIDFATLTGAARVALGTDLPGLFSNNDETAHALQQKSLDTLVDDPLWHLPLWSAYRKEMDSACADICSTGGKAGATIAALFLHEFIENDIEWVHVDCYAWRDSDTPTNPKGGADTGMRALFHYLEERYAQ